MNTALLYMLAVLLFATFIRSAFGFGEALIAVPLLAFCMPVQVAAPLAVLVSITVAAIVLLQDWRQVHARSAVWLLLWTALGIPLGLILLTRVDERLVKMILGSVIIAFSAYALMGRMPFQLKRDKPLWLLCFGFCAGVLGGAYGMNGPPLAMYGSLRRWSAGQFRATLQAYFLPASLIGFAGYWLAGLWVPRVTHDYLLSLPVTLVGILLGRQLNQRLHGRAFLVYIHAGLIMIGLTLCVQTAWHWQ